MNHTDERILKRLVIAMTMKRNLMLLCIRRLYKFLWWVDNAS